jgi:hypothetical protein
MSLQTYKRPRLIKHGSGKDGAVYQIAKGIVAKLCWTEMMTLHEARIAEKLYKCDISIPQPYGIQAIKFPDKGVIDAYAGKEIKGFIMEKIDGKTGKQLSLEERMRFLPLRDQELEKARDNGFFPLDGTYPGNLIITPYDEIKLIDFTRWSHRDIPRPDR